MNKIKNKSSSIIKDKYFWITVTLLIIIYFVRFLFVGTYGDDYMYKKVAISGLPQIIQFMKWHITECNGRTLVHCLVILFLRNDFLTIVWKLMSSILIPVSLFTVSELVSDKDETRKRCTVLLLIVFQLIGTVVYCESVYWTSGAFNYFYPTIGIIFALRLCQKKPTSYWLFPIAFFLGATTEQVGIMAVGLFVLLLADKLIKTKKADIRLVIQTVLSIVGYLCVVIAPGTMSRMKKQENISAFNIVYNFFVVLRENWFSSVFLISMIMFLTLSMVYWLVKFKEKNKITAFLNGKLAVYMIVSFCINSAFIFVSEMINHFVGGFEFSQTINNILLVLWLIYVVSFFAVFMYTAVMIYIYRQNILPFISFALGTGSQMVMGITPKPLYRSCIQAVFMYMIFLAFTFSDFADRQWTVKKKTVNKTILRRLSCVFCLMLAVIQAVALSYFMSPGAPTDLGEMKPMTSEETKIMTDKLLKDNTKYYQEQWDVHYDLNNFSKY